MSVLSTHLAKLLEFLTQAGNEPPAREVVVMEIERSVATDRDGRPIVKRSALMSPSSYEERFASLLTGGFPWLNMNAVGVDRGRLVVTIEVASSTSAPVTSVNYSGPSRLVLENGWSADRALAFVG